MTQEATLTIHLPKKTLEAFQAACSAMQTSPADVVGELVADFLRSKQSQHPLDGALEKFASTGELPPGIPNELALFKALLSTLPPKSSPDDKDFWEEDIPRAEWKSEEVF